MKDKDQIYASKNRGYSGVKWKSQRARRCKWNPFSHKDVVGVKANTKDITEGFCFGYSTIWIRQMLLYGREGTHPPSEFEAGILQQKFEKKAASSGIQRAVLRTMEELGLKLESRVESLWSHCAPRVSCEMGFYLIDIGIHWIAMGKDLEYLYYYDSNEGLFIFDSTSDFINKVSSSKLMGFYASHGWLSNPGKLCHLYKINNEQ